MSTGEKDPNDVVRWNITQFRGDFPKWVRDNPEIWKSFESLSLQMTKKRDHYGSKSIVEVVRFHSTLREKDKTFKINNNYTADLARLFELMHPEHKGFFERRRRTAA